MLSDSNGWCNKEPERPNSTSTSTHRSSSPRGGPPSIAVITPTWSQVPPPPNTNISECKCLIRRLVVILLVLLVTLLVTLVLVNSSILPRPLEMSSPRALVVLAIKWVVSREPKRPAQHTEDMSQTGRDTPQIQQELLALPLGSPCNMDTPQRPNSTAGGSSLERLPCLTRIGTLPCICKPPPPTPNTAVP